MIAWFVILLALGSPSQAKGKPAPPIIIDTEDGQALVNTKNGSLTLLSDLSRSEIDALGVGDPALLKKGAAAEERRQAARQILDGCFGDIKCWREGLARWEAAEKTETPVDPAAAQRRAEARARAIAQSKDRVEEICLDYAAHNRLEPDEQAFYDAYCK